jgi:hypothetical protein
MSNKFSDISHNPGGRKKTGYDLPKTVNFKASEYKTLADWGLKQNPSMNFSDVIHLMTSRFIENVVHPAVK